MQKLKNMGNEILKLTNEVVIDIDGIEAASVIDIMIARFPHLVKNIFKELGDESLTTCRTVSRQCYDYLDLDSERFLWIRMIQRYRKNMGISYPHWNKVLKNTPFELVKEFSVATQQFFKDDISRNDFHWSPLQIVAEQGNLTLCKYILEKTKNTEPCIQYNGDVYHTHPILMAAKKGHEEICKVLIDTSEEKNPSDALGITSFHFAAKEGLTDVCKLIMENIDNKNPAAINGITPLHLAAKKGHTDVCKLIIENIDNKNPAALNGCTPLHLAVDEGHLEIVRLLVETGVDKNSLVNGKTPLDFAGLFRSYAFYKLLSNNKTQLYSRIFVSLMFTAVINLFICLFIFVFELIIFAILSCLIPSELVNFRFSHLAPGILVNWVITVLLTFIILLKSGLTGKSVHFKYFLQNTMAGLRYFCSKLIWR